MNYIANVQQYGYISKIAIYQILNESTTATSLLF
jgi:hypothetical protein